jgi:hypothetical protein
MQVMQNLAPAIACTSIDFVSLSYCTDMLQMGIHPLVGFYTDLHQEFISLQLLHLVHHGKASGESSVHAA